MSINRVASRESIALPYMYKIQKTSITVSLVMPAFYLTAACLTKRTNLKMPNSFLDRFSLPAFTIPQGLFVASTLIAGGLEFIRK